MIVEAFRALDHFTLPVSNVDDVMREPMEVFVVGWVVAEDDNYLYVANGALIESGASPENKRDDLDVTALLKRSLIKRDVVGST